MQICLLRKRFLLVTVILFNTLIVFSQHPVQTVRGNVVDQQSKKGIEHASVIIEGMTGGIVTDSNGAFIIYKVPVGRITIQVSHIGYEPLRLFNIVVESGKETLLNPELIEKLNVTQKEIVISGRREKLSNRQMATVSAVEFNAEDSRRYAGSRNDVARMASNFAGVNSVNDGRNDIIIRGNSPLGLLWRLEVVDIPNPTITEVGATVDR